MTRAAVRGGPSASPSSSFADPELCRALHARIVALASRQPHVRLMEVCGTHTTAFFRTGVRGMLPRNVEVISGPGCPVCVTPTSYVDLALRLLREPRIAVATFGDMLRVPGSESSLERERALGARVEIVYSPLDVLPLARSRPQETFVFLGVGFETTAPGVATLIEMAEREGTANVRVLSGHKLVPPALEALLSSDAPAIDGLILPGHVSVILGSDAYRFVAERFAVPGVVCGFDPADLLGGVLDLLEMRARGEARIGNRYGRAVTPEGNRRARAALERVFEVETASWRGLGPIPASGLAIARPLSHRCLLYTSP
ncbi:MAG: hydrogenase formation protein HypD, partial [Candidatus Eisenbacteria bacterium]|nr:hydrogenase formation protein HypD [Candidatus Eisenbacteria bacterium]